jgi:hypothetical protein
MNREEAIRKFGLLTKAVRDAAEKERPNQQALKEKAELYEMAYAALRSPVPDPITGLVPCVYCNGNHETQAIIPSDPDTIWTIMPDRQQLSFINCNWGCEDHVVDINHCPMCGRKLREDTAE